MGKKTAEIKGEKKRKKRSREEANNSDLNTNMAKEEEEIGITEQYLNDESKREIKKQKKDKKKKKRRKGVENEDFVVGVHERPIEDLVNERGVAQNHVSGFEDAVNSSTSNTESNVGLDSGFNSKKGYDSETKIKHKKEKNKKEKQKGRDNKDLNVRVQETPIENLVEEGGVQKKHLSDLEDVMNSSGRNMEPNPGIDSMESNLKQKKKKMEKKKKKKMTEEKKNKKREKEKKKGFAEHESTVQSKKHSSNRTPKAVSFSEHVEVFPAHDDSSNMKNQDEGLVRGKRFSPEEDEMLKLAVLEYIDEKGLGDEGLNMVMHCKSYPEIKDCWKHIAAALPRRPLQSVYHRAHILFERDDKRTWTEEEYDLVRNFHEKHGSNWKMLAEALGKHRFHVKDTWRRIKMQNRKKGRWSQEEYQTLFDLVNTDLRLKALEEKRESKHGMLRDNISWEAISDKLSTRANAVCCQKWYRQLSSPMVVEGLWADADDYRLINALVDLDAACIEDVDWDNILEHRSGDLCLKRWNQMTKHLGNSGNKSFMEQVEVLAKRYCPDMLEAREAYDNKPLV